MKKGIMLLLMIFIVFTACCNTERLDGWSYRTKINVTNATASSNEIIEFKAWYGYPMIEEDGCFEWFARPVIRHVGKHDRTYIGYYKGKDEKTVIRYWDEITKSLSPEIDVFTSWGGGDDHSCPTIIVLKHQIGENAIHNGKLLVTDTEHNGALRTVRSVNAEDISSWETAMQVEMSYCSYANLWEANTGTIYLLYRWGCPGYWSGGWNMRTSVDAGVTWSSATLIFDAVNATSYFMFAQDADDTQLHCMINQAHKDEPSIGYHRYRDIYHCYFDVSAGTWRTTEGIGLTLPIDTSTLGRIPTLVHDTTEWHWEFLWDIKVINGSPVLLSVNQPRTFAAPGVQCNGDVYLHTWDGRSWFTETICTTGLVGTYSFSSGACLNEKDANVVYVCAPDGSGNSQMQKWEKSDGTWSNTEDITQASPGDHFRPMYVRGGAGLFRVLWCYTEYYIGWDGGQWISSLFAYPGYNNANNIKLNKTSRSDFGDLRFTDSDGVTLIGYQGRGKIVNKTDNWLATIRIKVRDIPAWPDKKVIYLYSGNSMATYPEDDSSEENALAEILFDDLTNLNLSIWSAESFGLGVKLSKNF